MSRKKDSELTARERVERINAREAKLIRINYIKELYGPLLVFEYQALRYIHEQYTITPTEFRTLTAAFIAQGDDNRANTTAIADLVPIAHKRYVRTCLRRLEASGYIDKVRNHSPGRPAQWSVTGLASSVFREFSEAINREVDKYESSRDPIK